MPMIYDSHPIHPGTYLHIAPYIIAIYKLNTKENIQSPQDIHLRNKKI